MNTIPLGAKGSFSMVVTPDHLASRFKDDETQEIGSGIHERALVDLRRLTQRLDAKGNQEQDIP